MANFEAGKTYKGSSIDGVIPVFLKVYSIEKQFNPDPLIYESSYLIFETQPPGLFKKQGVLFIDGDEDGVESVSFFHDGDLFLISAGACPNYKKRIK